MLYGRRPAAVPQLTKGSITLSTCSSKGATDGAAAYGGMCGTYTVPLDYTGTYPGTLTIGLEFYPHTGTGPSAGLVIAQEGGPGFSTTGSRDGYLRLLAPINVTKDIALIDKRGTGESSPLNCKALQNDTYSASLADYEACATQLGPQAYLYGTPQAADDIATGIALLGYTTADYYGDSYGTWFGQVLAARHPKLLTSIVLDSAYPVLGDDATTEVNAGQRAMQEACLRSAPCAALGGSATARFATLLASLRANPVTGVAPGDGDSYSVTANPAGLFLIIGNAGNAFTAWRDLDAAGRAWLQNGDSLPLLRLVAEANDSYQINGEGDTDYQFSVAESVAVQCADYGAPYDLTQSVAVRQQQYAAWVAQLQAQTPNLFAPFTINDAIYSQGDVEADDICLGWSVPPSFVNVGQPVPANQVFPNVPVLVVNGDLDTVVSPTEGRQAAALFPNATYIRASNLVHVTAISDGETYVSPNGMDLSNCVGPIVRNFIATEGQTGSIACTSPTAGTNPQTVRPIRTVPAFQTAWANTLPATAASGNQANANGLILASAVAETIGDVIGHYYAVTGSSNNGLRGGTWKIKPNPASLTGDNAVEPSGTGYTITLKNVKWTNDLTVNGTINWNQNTGDINATGVTFTTTDGHSGTITIDWNDTLNEATATLSGTVDGLTLAATRLAP